jgi:hypothetical protein
MPNNKVDLKSIVVERSPTFRAVYSHVQSWSISPNEAAVTFLRVEPKTIATEQGPRHDIATPRVVEELTVQMPIAVAKSLCEGLLNAIQAQARKK